MQVNNIAIIGFGEVGSTIGAILNSNYQNIIFNLFDFEDEISGRILDFKHACVINSNKVTVNDRSGIKEADFIIYTAGYSNKPGESRSSVAQKNKALISSIFGDLQVQKEAIVIVITNPVEPATFWVHEVLKGACTVIGTGTSLDTFRLQYILSKHFNCDPSEVETSVVGEHGEHMVPLFSQTKIKGVNIRELLQEAELIGITEELKSSASTIRKTEKATKFGVAETCHKIISTIIKADRTPINVSIPTIYKKVFGGNSEDSICISYPVIFEKSKPHIDVSIKISDSESQNLNKSVEKILNDL